MRPRSGTRALLEVYEALGESDDVVDRVRGEVGHVRQSRENAAPPRTVTVRTSLLGGRER